MIKNLLSIAGFDPSGGAGIAADLKTFAALGCNGMAVIAALTAQNTQGVRAVHVPLASFAAAQIDAVFEDIDVAAVKIYAARHGLQAPHIIECLTILQKSGFPAFELSLQLRCLLGVPLRILGL